MNPFAERPESIEKLFENWQTLYPRSYDKNAVDPYLRKTYDEYGSQTRTRAYALSGKTTATQTLPSQTD